MVYVNKYSPLLSSHDLKQIRLKAFFKPLKQVLHYVAPREE